MKIKLCAPEKITADVVLYRWYDINLFHGSFYDCNTDWLSPESPRTEFISMIRLRTQEDMAIARAKGKLRGNQPKLSDKQQKELYRMHGSGELSISDLAELFSVPCPTVYRTLSRIQK